MANPADLQRFTALPCCPCEPRCCSAGARQPRTPCCPAAGPQRWGCRGPGVQSPLYAEPSTAGGGCPAHLCTAPARTGGYPCSTAQPLGAGRSRHTPAGTGRPLAPPASPREKALPCHCLAGATGKTHGPARGYSASANKIDPSLKITPKMAPLYFTYPPPIPPLAVHPTSAMF